MNGVAIKSIIVICLLALQVSPGLLVPVPEASALTIKSFPDGSGEVMVSFEGPGLSRTVNLSLSPRCHVLKATMNVSTVSDGSGRRPSDIRFRLGDATPWGFHGTFGQQALFANETPNCTVEMGAGGGNESATVELPRNAIVQETQLRAKGFAPGRVVKLLELAYGSGDDDFAFSLSPAGDFNDDGFDDIILGDRSNSSCADTAGCAYLFEGGPGADGVADMLFLGQVGFDDLGYSVASADFNGDGIDDIAIGLPFNDTPDVNAGEVHIYLGGKNPDNAPDLVLQCGGGSHFGIALSSAGDFNGDGGSDLVVGAYTNSSVDLSAGSAYIYYGGSVLDEHPDVTFLQGRGLEYFGIGVAGAGDVNGDGCDDVLVGANMASYGQSKSGVVHVFHGGKQPDTVPDVTFPGEAADDSIGQFLAGAGDVNGDGFDDILVGCPNNDHAADRSGSAYLLLGGQSMDAVPDLYIRGENGRDTLGSSVSGAGDLNHDGYDDFLVGAEGYDSPSVKRGQVQVFFGGPGLDAVPDATLDGDENNDDFGHSVSPAGDFNDDGFTDFMIGDDNALIDRANSGEAWTCSFSHGISDPKIGIGNRFFWNHSWYFNATEECPDFSVPLNEHLRTAPSSGTDGYGNVHVDVPLTISAKSDGNITLSGLVVNYSCEAPVPDFSKMLNDYMAAHGGEMDERGNVTIPIRLSSATPGCLRLCNLSLLLDEAPDLLKIPSLEIEEDTAVTDLLDLREHFSDDYDGPGQLTLDLVSTTNATVVKVEVLGNQYLSVDALEGPLNDNWTGIVSIIVNCTDRWGSCTESNRFDVVVRNVNDAPVIVSEPPLTGAGGNEYSYRVAAVDGDGDPLAYGLTSGPPDMTIISSTGLLAWTPQRGGKYPVALAVSDGNASASQSFVITVPNRPPRILDEPVPQAFLDQPFAYRLPAIDDDGDELEFTLLSGPEKAFLESSTGNFSWTPRQVGEFPVSTRISDGEDEILHDFTVVVARGNRAPTIQSAPVRAGVVGVPYEYDVNATDPDTDPLAYDLLDAPANMTIDSSTGRIRWTPVAAGNITVKARVSDGNGGECLQEFIIQVDQRILPRVQVTFPRDGQKISGRMTITGTASKGNFEVVRVQVKVDDGPWTDAVGNYSWRFDLDTGTLKAGKHSILTRAWDPFVASDEMTVRFVVEKPAATGSAPISNTTLIASMVVIALVISASLIAFSRSRGSGPGKEARGKK